MGKNKQTDEKADSFKSKAKDTAEKVADDVYDAYKVAEGKAKLLARKTRLRAGIISDRAVVRRVSVELGTAYFDKYKDDDKNEFRHLCDQIAAANASIVEKENEIEALKKN